MFLVFRLMQTEEIPFFHLHIDEELFRSRILFVLFVEIGNQISNFEVERMGGFEVKKKGT